MLTEDTSAHSDKGRSAKPAPSAKAGSRPVKVPEADENKEPLPTSAEQDPGEDSDENEDHPAPKQLLFGYDEFLKLYHPNKGAKLRRATTSCP